MDLKYILNDDENAPPPRPIHKKVQKPRSPLISAEQRFWTSVSEPPDIDYRNILGKHFYKKKHYLDDHKMPFKERCAWIDFCDTIQLEWDLINTYYDWVRNKKVAAEGLESVKEKKFWAEFWEELKVDFGSIGWEDWEQWDWLANGLPEGLTYKQYVEREEEKRVACQKYDETDEKGAEEGRIARRKYLEDVERRKKEGRVAYEQWLEESDKKGVACDCLCIKCWKEWHDCECTE